MLCIMPTCPEMLDHFLNLLSVEVSQLSTAQREATHKLVLCDYTTWKLVMVFGSLTIPRGSLTIPRGSTVIGHLLCWVQCESVSVCV